MEPSRRGERTRAAWSVDSYRAPPGTEAVVRRRECRGRRRAQRRACRRPALRIGIHAGPAVVGRMGWGESFYLTAVGDTVHVAARLEQATKDYGAELVARRVTRTKLKSAPRVLSADIRAERGSYAARLPEVTTSEWLRRSQLPEISWNQIEPSCTTLRIFAGLRQNSAFSGVVRSAKCGRVSHSCLA